MKRVNFVFVNGGKSVVNVAYVVLVVFRSVRAGSLVWIGSRKQVNLLAGYVA